jgi:hypothetical protein
MMTAHYFHARTDVLANAVGKLPALKARQEELFRRDFEQQWHLPYFIG